MQGVPGAGRGAAQGGGQGVRGSPPWVSEGRAWERESPREPEQTSWPPHLGTFATYPLSAFCLCGPGGVGVEEMGVGAC